MLHQPCQERGGADPCDQKQTMKSGSSRRLRKTLRRPKMTFESRIASRAELWFERPQSSVRGAIPKRRSFAGNVVPCASERLADSGLESVGTSNWKERTHQCWCSCD